MIWLLSRLVVVPVKATAGGFKLGFWTGRTIGWRRIFVLGLGVAIGVLVAPGPGAELRARIRAWLDGAPAPAAPDTRFVVAEPPPPTDTVVVPVQPAASAPFASPAAPADPLPAAPDADPAAVDPSTY